MERRGNEPFFYLRPDEAVLRREGAAPGYALQRFLVSILLPTVLLGAFLLVLIPWNPSLQTWRGTAIGVYVALVVALALAAWRRWATTEYVLTDQRLYARTGRLFTSVHFTTYDKITDLRYHQGPVQRLLGVSSITFATAGGDVRMAGLRDAIAMKEAAEAARDAFIHRLLQEAEVELPRERGGAPSQAPEAPEAVQAVPEGEVPLPVAAPALPPYAGPRPAYLQAGDAPVWFAKPRTVAALAAAGPLVGLVLIAILSPSVRQMGFSGAPFLLAIGLFGAAIGLRVVQYRRTEYVATDRRVYARSGIVGTTVRQLTYDKITDITVRQDLLGRLLGYGSITLNTAGSTAAAITMHGLTDPLEAKGVVERLRSRYLREDERA